MHRLRSALLITIVSLLFSMIPIENVAAQSCDLNHLNVEFGGKMCVRSHCAAIHEKILFLGDKRLLYPNVSSDKGTIFQVGRTMEMKNVNGYWQASGPPGSVEFATASANQQGKRLILTIDQQWTQSGKQIAHAWRTIDLYFPDCTSCKLLRRELNFDVPEQERSFRSTFQNNFCEIKN